MSLHVKAGGSWRTTNNVYAKVNGSWKQIKQVYVKVNGVWKQIWTYAVSASDSLPAIDTWSNVDPYNLPSGVTSTKTYSTVAGTTATLTYNPITIGGQIGISLAVSGNTVISFSGATVASFSSNFSSSLVSSGKGTSWVQLYTSSSNSSYKYAQSSCSVTLNITSSTLKITTSTSGMCKGTGTISYMKPGS